MDVKDQISIMLVASQIVAGHFLLGRFDQESDHLTEIKVVDEATKVPPSTNSIRYDLLIDGIPLNDFVAANCTEWDGSSDIRLYFNVENGKYLNWTQTAKSTTAASV